MKLYSLAEVRAYLELADSELAWNDWLTRQADAMGERLQEYLRRQLSYQAGKVEYFHAPNKTLFLKAYPVTAVTSIVIEEEETIGTDYYRVDLARGVIYFKSWLYYDESPRAVAVTYTGGYPYSVVVGLTDVLTGLPISIKEGALMQAASEFKRRKELGLASFTMPDGSITKIADSWLPTVVSMLSPHRRMNV